MSTIAGVLHAEHISIDSVLEENCLDKIKGKGIPIGNFIKANNIALVNAKKSLKKKIVVFDGNFYYKKQIQHLMKIMEVPCYSFTLKAPLEICIKRDGGRKIIYGKDAAKAVYGLVASFDHGTVIHTENKTPQIVVNEILAYLPNSILHK